MPKSGNLMLGNKADGMVSEFSCEPCAGVLQIVMIDSRYGTIRR